MSFLTPFTSGKKCLEKLLKKADYYTKVVEIQKKILAKYFVEDESQNYLVFQPVFRYFKTPANNYKAIAWKSKTSLHEIVNLVLDY